MSVSPVPSSECSSRVLRTRFADQQFTSFVVTVGEENYVITAAHCIKPAPAVGAESPLFVQTDATSPRWDALPVTLIGRDDSPLVDLAVFRLHGFGERNWPDPVVGFTRELRRYPALGQDMFYFGYPAVDAFSYTATLPGGTHPAPVVRKGAFMTVQNGQYILDSLALPGFSGAPVYYQLGITGSWAIAGVVIGYPLVEKRVGLSDSDLPLFLRTDGNMTCCTPINKALDIIEAS